MYQKILLVIYLIIFIPALFRLISYRDNPGARRWTALLSLLGIVLAPVLAELVCALLTELFSILLLLLIFIIGFRMLFRSIIR